MNSEIFVAIPARFASTRFPGKPLAMIGKQHMINRVCEQALKSTARRVYACVDDERVAFALEGMDAVDICMTSPSARSGTDRIAEMIRIKDLPLDSVIVNVQGDEPLINPRHINQVAELLVSSGADMSTLCFRIDNEKDLFDPSCVKVVMDSKGFALYFSRAPIPYERDNFMHHKPFSFNHYHHIGIYAYRAKTVLAFADMEQCESEKAESLEQLRLLNAGMKIAVGITNEPPETGVDTPEDLERINALLRERGEI